MFPYVEISGLQMPCYGLLQIVALLAALVYSKVQSRIFGIPYRQMLTTLGITSTLSILFSILFNSIGVTHEIDFRQTQLSTIGAFFGFLIAVVIVASTFRTSLTMLIASLALPLSISQTIGRIGCFMAGCCHGSSCDYLLAVTFTDERSFAPQNVPLHPTQLYEAAATAIISVYIYRLQHKSRNFSIIFPFYILTYSTFRFFLDFIRDIDRTTILGHLSDSQGFAVLTILVSGLVVIRENRKFRLTRSPN